MDASKRYKLMALDKRLSLELRKGMAEIGVTNEEARWMMGRFIDILERHLDRIDELDKNEKFELVCV